eukprot:1107827-Prymnesium_polylepis.1
MHALGMYPRNVPISPTLKHVPMLRCGTTHPSPMILTAATANASAMTWPTLSVALIYSCSPPEQFNTEWLKARALYESD